MPPRIFLFLGSFESLIIVEKIIFRCHCGHIFSLRSTALDACGRVKTWLKSQVMLPGSYEGSFARIYLQSGYFLVTKKDIVITRKGPSGPS